MEFSFNKAFKEPLIIPEEIRKQSEKCSECQELEKIYVSSGTWTYACHKGCGYEDECGSDLSRQKTEWSDNE